LIAAAPQLPAEIDTRAIVEQALSTTADDSGASEQSAEPAVEPSQQSPELSDPLTDPATQPAITTTSRSAHQHFPEDPLEGFNRAMFGISMTLDKALYRPLAMGYDQVVPKPVRSGLRNFFRNLSEPIVLLNDLLQLKPLRAARTLARFVINSTVGLAGLLDVATYRTVGLPHHDNGFGNTLAYYGVHAGFYLFLPLAGPTTLRDLAGSSVDGAVLPVAVGKPFTELRYRIVNSVITGLDLRARSDPELRALFSGAVDRYATLRSVWLQNRAAEVLDLHSHRARPSTAPELQDPLSDPAVSAPPPIPRKSGGQN
jgi:phospholipid-binding lipoprotein MlaA